MCKQIDMTCPLSYQSLHVPGGDWGYVYVRMCIGTYAHVCSVHISGMKGGKVSDVQCEGSERWGDQRERGWYWYVRHYYNLMLASQLNWGSRTIDKHACLPLIHVFACMWSTLPHQLVYAHTYMYMYREFFSTGHFDTLKQHVSWVGGQESHASPPHVYAWACLWLQIMTSLFI